MEKAKLKKTANIAINTLLCLFLAVSIFAVFVTVLSRRGKDGTAEIFGYQMRIVTSDSMAACDMTDTSDFEIGSIPVRSMVFVKVMPADPEEAEEWYRSLKEGDVLTFRYVYDTQVTITHRITGAVVEKPSGGFRIELSGDNKSSEDGLLTQVIDTSVPNSPNYVIGKVVGQSYLLGLIMSFLMQPVGIVLVIIVPCVLIILSEVLKIARVLGAEKRKKLQEEKEKTEAEIADLRRRLAELEQGKDTAADEEADKVEEDEGDTQ